MFRTAVLLLTVGGGAVSCGGAAGSSVGSGGAVSVGGFGGNAGAGGNAVGGAGGGTVVADGTPGPPVAGYHRVFLQDFTTMASLQVNPGDMGSGIWIAHTPAAKDWFTFIDPVDYDWNLTPNPSDLRVAYVAVWASPNSPNY